jgi:hypothetical protein
MVACAAGIGGVTAANAASFEHVRVFDGNLHIDHDLTPLGVVLCNLEVVTGSLVAACCNQPAGQLTLPLLTTVGGDLSVFGGAIKCLALPRLVKVGGQLGAMYCKELEALELPRLAPPPKGPDNCDTFTLSAGGALGAGHVYPKRRRGAGGRTRPGRL